MNRDDVIAKIRKLLSLANSDNEHEALLAADTARRLMLEHDLQTADLAAPDGRILSQDMPEKRRIAEWEIALFAGVAEFTDCRSFTSIRGGRQCGMTIVGRTADVQVANYTFQFLRRAVVKFGRNYSHLHPRMKRATVDRYRLGLVARVVSNLRLQKVVDADLNAAAGQALVLAKDAAIEAFIDAQRWRVTAADRERSGRCDRAMMDGYRDGGQIAINPAMNGGRSAGALDA